MKKKIFFFVLIPVCLFISADFLAPYTAIQFRKDYPAYPPSRIHFIHENRWLGPFVYNRKKEPVRLKLFAVGEPYKILGLIPCSRHLFGTESNSAIIAVLGTDSFGRDVLSRLILGGRISLLIAAGAAGLSVFLSFFLGVVSAMYDGVIDKMIQFITESLKTIPRILLILLLSGLVPANASSLLRIGAVICILGISGWMYWEKIIRNVIYRERQKEFILYARTLGAGKNDIIRIHMLLLLKEYLPAAFMNTFPLMLLNEAMLSFLGAGIQEPSASWGLMLNQLDSASNLMQMPWLASAGLAPILTLIYFGRKNSKSQSIN